MMTRCRLCLLPSSALPPPILPSLLGSSPFPDVCVCVGATCLVLPMHTRPQTAHPLPSPSLPQAPPRPLASQEHTRTSPANAQRQPRDCWFVFCVPRGARSSAPDTSCIAACVFVTRLPTLQVMPRSLTGKGRVGDHESRQTPPPPLEGCCGMAGRAPIKSCERKKCFGHGEVTRKRRMRRRRRVRRRFCARLSARPHLRSPQP